MDGENCHCRTASSAACIRTPFPLMARTLFTVPSASIVSSSSTSPSMCHILAFCGYCGWTTLTGRRAAGATFEGEPGAGLSNRGTEDGPRARGKLSGWESVEIAVRLLDAVPSLKLEDSRPILDGTGFS